MLAKFNLLFLNPEASHFLTDYFFYQLGQAVRRVLVSLNCFREYLWEFILFPASSIMSNVKDLIDRYESLSPQPQQGRAVVAPPPAPASVLSEDYRSERDPSPVAPSEVSYKTSMGSDAFSTSDRQDSAR